MPDVQKPYTFYALGDTAVTLDFGNVIDSTVNTQVLGLFHKLKTLRLPCIRDVVPAYASLTVYYDVVWIHQHMEGEGTAAIAVQVLLEDLLSSLLTEKEEKQRYIKVPVCYSRKYAPDIYEMALVKGISVDDIIKLHTHQSYRVYMIGFMPGFPYMGEVDEQLAMPRRAQPRLKVEAGAVGIAGRQTGIYPQTSPGGWQIIGQTPMKLFDPQQQEPILLKPGDEVQFYSITEDEFESYKGRAA
jgi:inhibitor of KinA